LESWSIDTFLGRECYNETAGVCQFCGSRTNLEVHHQQFRSHSGEDKDNLITHYASIAALLPIPLTDFFDASNHEPHSPKFSGHENNP